MSGKIHLIKDESLGGVLREYVEIDRVANVSDKIVITDPSDLQFRDNYTKGTVMVVTKTNTDGSVYCEKFDLIDKDEYQTLEPTDIVRIDGQYYRMVERKAEAGEKVIVTDKGYGYPLGTVAKCEFSGCDTQISDGSRGIKHEHYFVLEPIRSTSEELTSKITDENRHEPIEKYTKEWNYVCEINENKTLIIPDAVNVEMVTEGVPETFVKFLDVNNEIVCLYKLNEIKGLYKNQIL